MSVTANLSSGDGRALVAELAARSDFIVETYPLGYLESIGLGFDSLSKRNPRLIYTSITPFGDRGPGKDYAWADIVTWAAGGMMYLMGESDKPPIQMSLPQAGLHAGAEAAVASLIAHSARHRDGLGQRVVVNMQAAIVWTLMNEQAMPILHGNHLNRTGVHVGSADARRKMVFECEDGHISILIAGGIVVGGSTRALIEWMGERGMALDWMRAKDWLAWVPGVAMAMTEQDYREIDELESTVQRFLLSMTKREIYAEGVKRRIFLAPVASAADIADDDQLKVRDFWVQVPHDTLDRSLTFPGPFAKMTATPIGASTRAPRIGEHNQEIYSGLLGIAQQRLEMLRAKGAI
jgi:crotonobetainyl-CoA:carnitine CoA-transferase CaiB-like acyl-CoA transferase